MTGDFNSQFGNEQIDEFVKIAKLLSIVGAKFSVVEMPLPNWVRNNAPHFLPFKERLSRLSATHGIQLIDLSASAADNEFRDEVHANDESKLLWSRRLGVKLNEFVKAGQ